MSLCQDKTNAKGTSTVFLYRHFDPRKEIGGVGIRLPHFPSHSVAKLFVHKITPKIQMCS